MSNLILLKSEVVYLHLEVSPSFRSTSENLEFCTVGLEEEILALKPSSLWTADPALSSPVSVDPALFLRFCYINMCKY